MKNTNKTILLLSAAAALASCNVKEESMQDSSKDIRCTVCIEGASLTRATGVTTAEEDNVKDLQLFVFDESGAKEYYTDVKNSQSGEIVSKEGKKKIFALVNAPGMSSVNSLTQLMGSTSLLSDNTLGGMVMTGEADVIVQSGGRITINVTRIVSKVSIKKITTSFSASSLAGKELKIKSIYLINVAGDNQYSATASPGLWYNKLSDGRNDPGCGTFSLLSDPVNSIIQNKSSYIKEHSFYCYPNPVSEESFDSTWSPRHTMLVIDALLGGEQTYYPIELPVIGRNKCIMIDELIITRKGSDYPYIPVTDGTCSVSVQVVPWDVIFNHTETI
ncbi:MAG: fimbrial protein [Bacteroidia bacterium]|nr:fimbrial protein [Bacteroidia bacterium]